MVVLAPFREGGFPAILPFTVALVATCIHGGGHEEARGLDRVGSGAEHGRRGNIVGGPALGSAQRRRPPRVCPPRRSGHHQPSTRTVLSPLETPVRWVHAHLTAGEVAVRGWRALAEIGVSTPRSHGSFANPTVVGFQSAGATALDRSLGLRPTNAVLTTRSAMARPSPPPVGP
jgi:hypothetical protein